MNMICSRDDQTCVDSGVEMNGDTTASNRTSYSSTIDTIDLKAISSSHHDMTDSTLKDNSTSSSETLVVDKPKKKVSSSSATRRSTGSPTKKKLASATDKTTPTKSGGSRTSKIGSGTGVLSRGGSDKSPRTNTAPKTAANGVFDRLSGSTKSRTVTASSRTVSRESVVSLDSTTSAATINDTVKPKRSSLNSKPSSSRSATLSGDKVTHKKIVKKTPVNDENSSSGGTVRRSTSSVTRTHSSAAPAGRPKSLRASLNTKSAATEGASGAEEGSSFLKKMLAAKAAAIRAS